MRGKRFKNLGYYVLTLAVLLAALALRSVDPAPIANLRHATFDTYQRIAPRVYDANLPVRIIDIDEASLQRMGQWPWPRSLIAVLVDKLTKAGAAAIAFDIVFPEPDRLSPRELLQSIPDDALPEAVRGALNELPSNDEIFAEVAARAPLVAGLVLSDRAVNPAPPPRAGFVHGGDDPLQFLSTYGGAVGNIEVLQNNAAGLGALNWVPENDQIIRRVPLILGSEGRIYPSLSAEALRVAQGASTYVIKSSGASGELSFGEQIGVVAVKIGGIVIPTDGNGHVWVHFTEPTQERYIPAWKVLKNEMPDDAVAGRIVFIGTSAAGLFDLQTTPVASGVPGVESHAQALESMFVGALLIRPDYALGLELVYLLCAGLLLIGLMRWLAVRWCLVACLACLVAVNAGSWFAFKDAKLLLDPVYPSIGLVAVFVAGELNLFFQTEGERRFIQGAFSRYLSPDLVERLGAQHDALELGGEIRHMTLMFCDVRGFTQISENLSAGELTSLINRFLTPMTDAILEHRGTIDKYMGDAIMAFWNAPLDDPSHAENACHAAFDMMVRLDVLNENLRQEAEAAGKPFKPIRIGIGVNTGETCVGNMGSSHRFDYSVIGDNVNVASRLEGQTKAYGVTAIAGEATVREAGDVASVELDLIRVKGKDQAERIFTLVREGLPPGDGGENAFLEVHTAMLSAYRGQDWAGAREKIAACKAAGPAELKGYYDILAQRIDTLEASPPGADWDGTFDAISK